MPSLIEHRIDRRARLLAEAARHQIDVYKEMLRPVGGLPVGTDQITTDEAYEFWGKHRFDSIGRHILTDYTPAKIAELDAWLTQEQNRRANAGLV